MRINKKISDENRFELKTIIQALVVPNKEIEEGLQKDNELEKGDDYDKNSLFSKRTLTIELKPKVLNKSLLAYLRAHCLMFFSGKDIGSIRVTEPTDLEYELMILDTYEKVLTSFKEKNEGRFDIDCEDEINAKASYEHRNLFIRQYRTEQCKILANQFSLLKTMKLILNSVKLVKFTSYTYQITQMCAGSQEHFVNCLHMRRYLKTLFAPQDEMPVPTDSEGDSEDEAPQLINNGK